MTNTGLTVVKRIYLLVFVAIFVMCGNSASALTAGPINATAYSGSDIGAQINAAFASSACNNSCTVYVPPGRYTFSTQIALPTAASPGVYELQMDAGAVLSYTGSSDAILTANNANYHVLIDGGQLVGNSVATSGIKIRTTQGLTVRDMLIRDFTQGDGIAVAGASAINIWNNRFDNDLNGIELYNVALGSVNETPDAVRVIGNEFFQDIHWAVLERNAGAGTQLLGNTYYMNVFESNGQAAGSTYGAIMLGYSRATVVANNYFEGNPRNVVAGLSNSVGIVIRDNYFEPVSGLYTIELNAVADPVVEGNVENGTGKCFLNYTSGGETGAYIGKNHVESTNFSCLGGTSWIPQMGSEFTFGSKTSGSGTGANQSGATLQTSANAPTASCNYGITITPAGLYVCQSGAWVKK